MDKKLTSKINSVLLADCLPTKIVILPTTFVFLIASVPDSSKMPNSHEYDLQNKVYWLSRGPTWRYTTKLAPKSLLAFECPLPFGALYSSTPKALLSPKSRSKSFCRYLSSTNIFWK